MIELHYAYPKSDYADRAGSRNPRMKTTFDKEGAFFVKSPGGYPIFVGRGKDPVLESIFNSRTPGESVMVTWAELRSYDRTRIKIAIGRGEFTDCFLYAWEADIIEDLKNSLIVTVKSAWLERFVDVLFLRGIAWEVISEGGEDVD